MAKAFDGVCAFCGEKISYNVILYREDIQQRYTRIIFKNFSGRGKEKKQTMSFLLI